MADTAGGRRKEKEEEEGKMTVELCTAPITSSLAR